MVSQIETARKRIAQIETLLRAIQERFEQDKNDMEGLDWSDISVMGRVIELLEETERFYRSLQP